MAQLETETDFGPGVRKHFVVTDEEGMYLMEFDTARQAHRYIERREWIHKYQRKHQEVK